MQDREPLSDAETLHQAHEVVEQLGYLPNQNRLSDLGHYRLSTVVARHGSAARYAAAHGLPYPRA